MSNMNLDDTLNGTHPGPHNGGWHHNRTTYLDADTVLAWNQHTLDAIQTSGSTPCTRPGLSRWRALSRCRAQARRVAHRLLSGRDTGRIAPRLERFGAEEAVSASRDEMTRNGEDVVGGRVQGQEPLG